MQLMVIQDSDRLKIGSISAQVGMELANGYKVVKVNEKSVIAEYHGHTEKFFDPTSIFYTEATGWGFISSVVDERAEGLAGITRKFRRGEAIFQQDYERNTTLSLDNSIESAGYNFAKEMQAKRESAILELKGE